MTSTPPEAPRFERQQTSRLARSTRRMARFLRRRRGGSSADAMLRTTLAILEAQQEATPDGVLVVGMDGQVLTCNRRFLELLKIPVDSLEGVTDTDLLAYAQRNVANWDEFIDQVNYLYEHPLESRMGDRIELNDRRVLSRASVPIIVDGEVRGRAWHFTETTETLRAEKLREALFRIAELSREAKSLDEFYAAVHGIVGELMNANNFYIAELDAEGRRLTFPYFVDELDGAPEGLDPGRGLTAYVLRTGEPLLVTPEIFQTLLEAGEVEELGAPSVDWLGVPLKSGDRTWGVIGTQTYTESKRYSEQDRDLLVFVARHIAGAIEEKRHEEALRSSELRYREMFENTRAVQWLLDPTTGAIVDVNVAACEFYGYTREELLSMRVWDVNVLDESDVRSELTRAAARERAYFHFRHRLRSGEIREVEVHSGPIEVQGRRLLYSIIHDITERKRAEEAQQRSETKYRVIFDSAPIGIYQSAPNGEIITANAALAKMLGYDSIEELLGRNLEQDVYQSDRGKVVEEFAREGKVHDLELRWRRKDGSALWVQLNAHAIHTSDETVYYEGFVHDISARKEAEDLLRKQSAAMTAAMDGIGILDAQLDFTYVNESLPRLFGHESPDSVLGRSLCALYEPHEQIRFVTSIIPLVLEKGQWRGEATGMRADGSSFPQEISLTAVGGGSIVCVVRDITERTYAEEQIKHLAYHDALTSLPNRLLFKDRVTVALSQAQREDSRVAVLFLDVDRFKVINDSLGHNVGDQLLQAVAERLQASVRESDTVARLGGDEFIVLLSRLHVADDALAVATKIMESIRHPFHLEGREFFVTTSMGVSIFPEDGGDADTLIKNADTAMYQAKEVGRDNYQMFNALVNARALQRISVEQGLRRGLANNEFSVHYQPIVDLRNGAITGTEALLRWKHPEMGQIAPGDFIPIAEATGAMIPIGNWALETACRQAKQWHDAGHTQLSLSVNLSVTQLQQPDLTGTVRDILSRTGLPPRFLELEITESSAMINPETSIRTLQELKGLGVRISLDDFGTGHSSLSYIKRFPIDTLKIDQSFVRDITTDADTAAIVVAIIAMAHSLRLRSTAEGVERTEQAEFLRRYGCDQMQGFLITRPVPPEQLVVMLH